MISTGSRAAKGFSIIEQSATERLQERYPAGIELYAESLDIIRFPSERYRRIFRDYLRDKYSDDVPDLVILFYVGNVAVAAPILGELFPGTPVIISGLSEEDISTHELGAHTAGIVQRSDIDGTIKLIQRLQPDIRRLVLVGGTADVDRQVMNRARETLRGVDGQMSFEAWDQLSIQQLLEAVQALPPQTAILFTRMFRDGAGRPTISTDAAHSIAKVASVPVYVMAGPMIGTGAVGGSVADIAALGRQAGELAYKVLDGAEPKSLPLQIASRGVPIFDWRALQRWDIPESRLPRESIVRFKPESLWVQYRWYFVAAALVFILQAALIAGLMVQRTRRRRVEFELRQSQELIDTATAAADLGLWVRDLKNGALWGNDRLRSIFGFPPNDPLRLDDLVARIHTDDRSRVASTVEHAQETSSQFETEFRVILPDGNERWLLAKGQGSDHLNGSEQRRMGVVMDITTRKGAESLERRHREELAHAARRAMAGELTASIAHELNQPLGAILANAEAAEMLLKDEPPALKEVGEILADIRNDDRRASEVIQGLRRLLRKEQVEREPLQINDAVGEVLRLLSIDAAHRKITLKFEPAKKLPLVDGDRVQLQQVLSNLVLNAMDAMAGLPDERRQVVVRSGLSDGDMITIAVSDLGSGVAPDKLRQLFEPFFTTREGGMGIGLSIARSIIEAHQGRIWAENNPSAGATFYFTIPFSKELPA